MNTPATATSENHTARAESKTFEGVKAHMKIAIMGTRGIPANYGGFETFAEELSTRLVKSGHDVTVYCRSHYATTGKKFYKGVRLVVLPTLRTKYFDTVVHTFLSTLHGIFQGYDVILICNSANTIFSVIPRLFGKKVIVNVDGLERKRQKWSWVGKAYYRLSEYLSTFLPNVTVTDAITIQRYYLEKYNKESQFIPYGADYVSLHSTEALEKNGLEPQKYVVYVSRLEPENNAHRVIKAFEKVKSPYKLAIVGDAPYSKKYITRLKRTKDPRIIFTGAIYGKGYRELLHHSICYIHATEVGGTHPALIEAMSQGCLVIANGTPENIEVLGEAGMVYKKNNVDQLTESMQAVLNDPKEFDIFRRKARERIRKFYSWDAVVKQYENLFWSVLQ